MRSYSDAERAEAVGLAMTIGVQATAERTGVPRRTVSHWLQHSGHVVRITPATAGQVADELWASIQEGLAAVRAGLADPRARLGDRAKALAVLIESHRLMTGQATAITSNTNLGVDVNEAIARGRDLRPQAERVRGFREYMQWVARGGTDDELIEALPDIAGLSRLDPTDPRTVALIVRGIVMPGDDVSESVDG